MPAGIHYNVTPLNTERELYNVKSSYRLQGGFNLVADNLKDGSYIDVLTPLAIDFKTRKAIPLKSVKIVEAADGTGTTYKIAKGSLAYEGMIIGTGAKGAEIANINKDNADYDSITTAAALGAAVKVGDVLFEASAAGGTTLKHVPNALNYARVKVEVGATVTALGQAYEIREPKLYVPVSQKEKDALGDRFMFVNF